MNIDGMSEAERYEAFLKAWEAHKKSGFAQTQEEADRIAAMWNVKAPKLPPPIQPASPPRGSGGTWMGSGGDW